MFSRLPGGILGSGGSMFLTAWTALFKREGFFSLAWAFSLSLVNDDVEEVTEAASKEAWGLESPGMLVLGTVG